MIKETNEQRICAAQALVSLVNAALILSFQHSFLRGLMKKHLQVAIAAALVLGTLSLHAQSDTAGPAKASTKAKKRTPKKAEETAEQNAIRDLQEKMAAQQAEIDELKQQNAVKDAALSAAQSTAAAAQTQAAAATTEAQSAAAAAQTQAEAVTGIKSEERFDLVVLATGMQPSCAGTKLPVELPVDDDGFIIGDADKGVYAAGCAKLPLDVMKTAQTGTGAALKAIQNVVGR